MSEPQPFEFRSPHGVKRVECQSRWFNGITVRHVTQFLDAGRVWHDLSSKETTVAILLEQVGGYCEPRINLNRPTLRERFDAGHTVFVPAEMTIWGYSDNIRLTRDLRMIFQAERLEMILGEDLERTKATTPLLMLYDDRVAKLADLLAEECKYSPSSNALYGESLTTALTALLFGARKISPDRCASGLAKWQLRRAQEYFEERLSQDVNLQEVANLTGLSQSQFARAFKASTGVPPYRWFLDARVKLAQELLLQGKIGIADIATQVGFADQSHFTKTFRRATGATPKDWQRDRRL
jgi:AraC family transcriptional regulator